MNSDIKKKGKVVKDKVGYGSDVTIYHLTKEELEKYLKNIGKREVKRKIKGY